MFRRFLALILSFSLLATSLPAQAAPTDPLSKLTPSSRIGFITDHFGGQPKVILIQDLHAHYGAQKNIAKLLEFFDSRLRDSVIPRVRKGDSTLRNSGISESPPFALAVEGAEGPIDLSPLVGTVPGLPEGLSPALRNEALDYLMREGELTGMEYFAITHNQPHLLQGVEDFRYYNTHRELFRQTYEKREKLVLRLTAIQRDLQDLRPKVYSPELRKLIEKGGAFWEEADEITHFMKKLELATTPEAKALLQVERDLELLLKIADLRATEREVRAFGPRLQPFIAMAEDLLRPASDVLRPTSNSRPRTSDLGRATDAQEITELLNASVDYYALAMVRNEPMVEKTLGLLTARREEGGVKRDTTSDPSSLLPPRPASVAVLVAGGFHTAPITQMLKKRGISYMVLTPMVDRVRPEDHDRYIKRLRGIHLTYEEVAAAARSARRPIVRMTRSLSNYLPRRAHILTAGFDFTKEQLRALQTYLQVRQSRGVDIDDLSQEEQQLDDDQSLKLDAPPWIPPSWWSVWERIAESILHLLVMAGVSRRWLSAIVMRNNVEERVIFNLALSEKKEQMRTRYISEFNNKLNSSTLEERMAAIAAIDASDETAITLLKDVATWDFPYVGVVAVEKMLEFPERLAQPVIFKLLEMAEDLHPLVYEKAYVGAVEKGWIKGDSSSTSMFSVAAALAAAGMGAEAVAQAQPVSEGLQVDAPPAMVKVANEYKRLLLDAADAWEKGGNPVYARYARKIAGRFQVSTGFDGLYAVSPHRAGDGAFVIGTDGLLEFDFRVDFSHLQEWLAALRHIQKNPFADSLKKHMKSLLFLSTVKEMEGLHYMQQHPELGVSDRQLQLWTYEERKTQAIKHPRELKGTRLAELIRYRTALWGMLESSGYVGELNYLRAQNISPEDLEKISKLEMWSMDNVRFLTNTANALRKDLAQTSVAMRYWHTTLDHMSRAVVVANPAADVGEIFEMYRIAYGVEVADGHAVLDPQARIQPKKDLRTGQTDPAVFSYLRDPNFFQPSPESLRKRFGVAGDPEQNPSSWVGVWLGAVSIVTTIVFGLATWRWNRARQQKTVQARRLKALREFLGPRHVPSDLLHKLAEDLPSMKFQAAMEYMPKHGISVRGRQAEIIELLKILKNTDRPASIVLSALDALVAAGILDEGAWPVEKRIKAGRIGMRVEQFLGVVIGVVSIFIPALAGIPAMFAVLHWIPESYTAYTQGRAPPFWAFTKQLVVLGLYGLPGFLALALNLPFEFALPLALVSGLAAAWNHQRFDNKIFERMTPLKGKEAANTSRTAETRRELFERVAVVMAGGAIVSDSEAQTNQDLEKIRAFVLALPDQLAGIQDYPLSKGVRRFVQIIAPRMRMMPGNDSFSFFSVTVPRSADGAFHRDYLQSFELHVNPALLEWVRVIPRLSGKDQATARLMVLMYLDMAQSPLVILTHPQDSRDIGQAEYLLRTWMVGFMRPFKENPSRLDGELHEQKVFGKAVMAYMTLVAEAQFESVDRSLEWIDSPLLTRKTVESLRSALATKAPQAARMIKEWERLFDHYVSEGLSVESQVLEDTSLSEMSPVERLSNFGAILSRSIAFHGGTQESLLWVVDHFHRDVPSLFGGGEIMKFVMEIRNLAEIMEINEGRFDGAFGGRRSNYMEYLSEIGSDELKPAALRKLLGLPASSAVSNLPWAISPAVFGPQTPRGDRPGRDRRVDDVLPTPAHKRARGSVNRNSVEIPSDARSDAMAEIREKVRDAGYQALEHLVLASIKRPPIGNGREAVVYEIPNMPGYVLRILLAQLDEIDMGVALSSLNLQTVPRFEGILAGQPVARLNASIMILEKAPGTPAGIPSEVSNPRQRYEDNIQRIARMPQSAFDRLAADLAQLNEQGGRFDAGDSNNLMVDDSEQVFRMTDLQYGTMKHSNNVGHMIKVMLNLRQIGRGGRDLSMDYFQILDKVLKAATKAGLPLPLSYENPYLITEIGFGLAGLEGQWESVSKQYLDGMFYEQSLSDAISASVDKAPYPTEEINASDGTAEDDGSPAAIAFLKALREGAPFKEAISQGKRGLLWEMTIGTILGLASLIGVVMAVPGAVYFAVALLLAAFGFAVYHWRVAAQIPKKSGLSPPPGWGRLSQTIVLCLYAIPALALAFVQHYLGSLPIEAIIPAALLLVAAPLIHRWYDHRIFNRVEKGKKATPSSGSIPITRFFELRIAEVLESGTLTEEEKDVNVQRLWSDFVNTLQKLGVSDPIDKTDVHGASAQRIAREVGRILDLLMKRDAFYSRRVSLGNSNVPVVLVEDEITTYHRGYRMVTINGSEMVAAQRRMEVSLESVLRDTLIEEIGHAGDHAALAGLHGAPVIRAGSELDSYAQLHPVEDIEQQILELAYDCRSLFLAHDELAFRDAIERIVDISQSPGSINHHWAASFALMQIARAAGLATHDDESINQAIGRLRREVESGNLFQLRLKLEKLMQLNMNLPTKVFRGADSLLPVLSADGKSIVDPGWLRKMVQELAGAIRKNEPLTRDNTLRSDGTGPGGSPASFILSVLDALIAKGILKEADWPAERRVKWARFGMRVEQVLGVGIGVASIFLPVLAWIPAIFAVLHWIPESYTAYTQGRAPPLGSFARQFVVLSLYGLPGFLAPVLNLPFEFALPLALISGLAAAWNHQRFDNKIFRRMMRSKNKKAETIQSKADETDSSRRNWLKIAAGGLGAGWADQLRAQVSDEEILKVLEKDMGAIPREVRQAYLRRLIEDVNWFAEHPHETEEFLKKIGQSNEMLLKHGYFTVAVLANKGSVLNPKMHLRSVVAQFDPEPDYRMVEGQRVRVYHIRRVSGYVKLFEDNLGMSWGGLPMTVFIFDERVKGIAEKFVAFRRANPKQAAGKWKALKATIRFDDPLAREIMLETFDGIPDDGILEALKEQIFVHELLHNWIVDLVGAKGEKGAYLGGLALAKNPYFQLLRIAHLHQGALESLDNVLENSTGLATGIILESVARGLIEKKLLSENDFHVMAKGGLEFIRFLRQKGITRDQLRDTAQQLFVKEYGALPKHALTAGIRRKTGAGATATAVSASYRPFATGPARFGRTNPLLMGPDKRDDDASRTPASMSPPGVESGTAIVPPAEQVTDASVHDAQEDLSELSSPAGLALARNLSALFDEIRFDYANRYLRNPEDYGDYHTSPLPVPWHSTNVAHMRAHLRPSPDDPPDYADAIDRARLAFEFFVFGTALGESDMGKLFGSSRKNLIGESLSVNFIQKLESGRFRLNNLSLISRKLPNGKVIYLFGDNPPYFESTLPFPRVYLGPDSYRLMNRILEEKSGLTGVAVEAGSGSGIQLIAALLTFNISKAIGVEIDERAINVSRFNAAINGVDDRMAVVRDEAGLDAALKGEKISLAFSNPPFLAMPGRVAIDVRDRSVWSQVTTLLKRPLSIDLSLLFPLYGWGGPDGLTVTRRFLDLILPRLGAHGKMIIYSQFAGDEYGPTKIRQEIDSRGFRIISRPKYFEGDSEFTLKIPADDSAKNKIGFLKSLWPPLRAIDHATVRAVDDLARRVTAVYRAQGITHFHDGSIVIVPDSGSKTNYMNKVPVTSNQPGSPAGTGQKGTIHSSVLGALGWGIWWLAAFRGDRGWDMLKRAGRFFVAGLRNLMGRRGEGAMGRDNMDLKVEMQRLEKFMNDQGYEAEVVASPSRWMFSAGRVEFLGGKKVRIYINPYLNAQDWIYVALHEMKHVEYRTKALDQVQPRNTTGLLGQVQRWHREERWVMRETEDAWAEAQVRAQDLVMDVVKAMALAMNPGSLVDVVSSALARQIRNRLNEQERKDVLGWRRSILGAA